ncbi:hypothetical protein SRABI106_01607 [Rahnella aquatilis]|nr:hypothetical protein SRABI106_01607 [Rahnella aquatilis]
MQLVGAMDLIHIDLHAQPRFFRHFDFPVHNLQRLFGQALVAFLPDPVRIYRCRFTRYGCTDMGKHRQRNVEMVIRMAAPRQAPLITKLCDPHRAMHGPEMRIRQRNIHRLQHHRVLHLAPVSGNHVCGDRQTGSTAEFRHHFAAGKTLLRTARIFGIAEDTVQVFAQVDCFIQQPRAVRINRDPRIREAFCQCFNRLDLLLARQHAAFEFEIFEAIAILRRFGQPHHRLTVHRFLMTQVIPVVMAAFPFLIRQIGFLPVTDIKQITEHRDFVALFARPEQFTHRHAEEFAHQIQQRGFQCGDGVNAQFERPCTFTERVKIR